MIFKKGLASKLKLVWISGDEALSVVKTSLESEDSIFKNTYTGGTLSAWNFDPIYVVSALPKHFHKEPKLSSVTECRMIGAAYWFHKWLRDQLDELANAFVAGHRKYPT